MDKSYSGSRIFGVVPAHIVHTVRMYYVLQYMCICIATRLQQAPFFRTINGVDDSRFLVSDTCNRTRPTITTDDKAERKREREKDRLVAIQ